MPWKETCPMDHRIDFISCCLRDEAPMSELCAAFAISRKTGYKWLERFREGGLAALEDRSHAAQQQPRRIPEEIE